MQLSQNQKIWVKKIVNGELNSLYSFCCKYLSEKSEWSRDYYRTEIVPTLNEFLALWDSLVNAQLVRVIEKVAETETWTVPLKPQVDTYEHWKTITKDYTNKEICPMPVLANFITGIFRYKTENERANLRSSILTYTATLAAVASIALGIWQTKITSLHNRISLRPQLSTVLTHYDSRFELQLKNDGIGPAIVDTLILLNDSMSIDKYFIQKFPKLFILDFEYSNPIGSVINSNDKITFYTFYCQDSDAQQFIKDSLLSFLPIIVKYHSSYNEKFYLKGVSMDIGRID